MADKEKARERARVYYIANREAVKAKVRAYAAAHRDKISAYKQAYRLTHKEELSAKAKARYRREAKAVIAKQKAYAVAKREAVKAYKKQWHAKNKQRIAAERHSNRHLLRLQHKKWYEKNYPGQREKYIERNAKRRALKANTQVERINYMQILRDAKGLCGICKKPLDLFGIDFDHIIPLARGGTHTRDNIQPSHAYCNRSKGAKVV